MNDLRTNTGRLPGIPVFVLVVSLLFTVVAVWYVDESNRRTQRARFERAMVNVVSQVDRRVATYVNVLFATSAFLALEEGITPTEFDRYVGALDLPQRLPGMQGIGFTERISPEEVPGIEDLMSQWHEGFRVWPLDPRSEYYAVTLLEPDDARNRAAIGYDMWSNPVRRRAMAQARDTGRAAMSGHVTLVQEITDDRQPGFLIYVPVYRGDPVTVIERRTQITGFAYSPFRSGDFFRTAVDPATSAPIRFEIYDGVHEDPEALLYASSERLAGFIPPADLARTIRFDVPARQWTIVFEATPAFLAESDRRLTWWTAGLGVGISLLLFLSTSALARARNEAENRARDLRTSQEALRESQSRLTRLVEGNIIGIITVEADGAILDANDAFLRMVGDGDASLAEMRLDELIDPGDRKKLDLARHELRARSVHAPFETTLHTPDGRLVPVVMGAAATEGGSDRSIAFVLDVSDRRRAEQERDRLLERERELRSEAEAANVAKDEFLATLSHELRTPMTTILGWARMLEAGDLDEETTRQAVEVIRRSSQVQAQLIDDLLDVSRIMVGKLRLSQQELDLREVVSDAVENFSQGAEAKGVQLVVDVPDEEVPVFGDAARLQQVVWNLVSNAMKFTPAGGRISVELERETESVVIRVSDTGAGIEPEFFPYVFERFRQADATSTRAHGGLGLGLSIVRTIVELHGGRISVHSEGADSGSTFTVVLPIGRAAALRSGSASGPRRALTRDALDGLSILLVEDNLEVRQMVDVTLSRLGAAVVAVGSVDEALRELSVRTFSAVVSDIAMPERDGYELIREMRSSVSPTTRQTPAIALTAQTRGEDSGRLADAGFRGIVYKPVDGDALAKSILDVVEAREAAGEADS